MIQEKTGKVTFGTAIKDFFKGYIDFKGRTTRAGYWWATLVALMIFVAEIVVLNAIISDLLAAMNLSLIILIVCLGLPLLALQARRYRDIGISNIGIAIMIIAPIVLGFILPEQKGIV